MTASEQEKVVREYWEHVFYHPRYIRYSREISVLVECGGKCFYGVTIEEAWSAAYDYTLDHQRKKAELEEEIEEMKFIVDVYEDNDEGPIFSRTLARLQSLLEQHMRGVRKDAE